MPLFCDLETFSTVPIAHGTHAYAEGAEVMLWTYALDEGPVECWDLTGGAPMPTVLRRGLADDQVMTVWHNGGMFDSVVLRATGLVDLPPERIHDTMVQAFAHGLPGALDKLCQLLGLSDEDSKDKNGRRLIQLFCKPQPKNHKIRRATKATHPAEWEAFIAYAKADITAMREVYKRLPSWNFNPDERVFWRLDQRINQRGVCIDTELVTKAQAAVSGAKRGLADQTAALTDGALASTTQRDAFLLYILEEHGVVLADCRSATLEQVLDTDQNLPPEVRELINIRLQAGSNASSKYKKIEHYLSRDGRLRGLLQFCGAQRTGRWGGRGPQFQNLMRPTLSAAEIEFAIDALKAGALDIT